MNKSWLNEKVTLTFDLVDSLLDAYFKLINEESIEFNNKLNNDEIEKLRKIFIKKILECQSCCKNKIKYVSYKDIFYILNQVYNSPEYEDKDVDIITEVYALTCYFYKYINKKNPLL